MNSLKIRVSSLEITDPIIPHPSLLLSKHSSEEVKPSKLLCMKNKLKNTLSTSKLKCRSMEVTGVEQYKLPEGKSIEHLYKIYEIVGEGTTSVAKRAISTSTGAEVVLKIFRTNDQELLLNILQEYELQSSLDHPNIVKAYNFHYDAINSKAYIVLEYVKGTTLSTMINNGMLDEAKALSIFWQCINALAFMHRNSIIHRDLQPCNVLISINGSAKLADFSVATKNKPSLFIREGTMDFMSPEVLKGESYNEKIDLWSMGILLYMMVVGQYPFPKDSNKAQTTSIISAAYIKDCESWERVSYQTKKLVDCLLKADPISRGVNECSLLTAMDEFFVNNAYKSSPID